MIEIIYNETSASYGVCVIWVTKKTNNGKTYSRACNWIRHSKRWAIHASKTSTTVLVAYPSWTISIVTNSARMRVSLSSTKGTIISLWTYICRFCLGFWFTVISLWTHNTLGLALQIFESTICTIWTFLGKSILGRNKFTLNISDWKKMTLQIIMKYLEHFIYIYIYILVQTSGGKYLNKKWCIWAEILNYTLHSLHSLHPHHPPTP